MLSIGVARNADYYTRLAQSAYYTNAPEAPGQWHGVGAEKLGLTGEISDPEAFRKLFSGYGKNGEKLVQNAGKDDRKNAWDLTFSAPKAFSTLWAIGNEEQRAKLESIHERAMKAALEQLNEHVVTRTGKGGVNREKCDLIYALFEHTTSRSEEPQLHTHALLMNIGVRADGKTSALETHDLFRMRLTAGAYYRAEVARLSKEELGLRFERIEKNCIELWGRVKELCAHWSTRSKEIDEYVKEHGISNGGKGKAFACTETRSKKDMERSREENLQRWKEEAKEMGHTYDSLYQSMRRESLLQKAKDPHLSLTEKERKEAVKAEITATVKERLFKEQSHFTQVKLAQTVAEESQLSGLTISEIKGVGESIKKDLVHLYDQKNGLTHYTTKETITQEKELITNAETLTKNNTHIVSPKSRMSFLSPELSDEQKLAFLHVTEPGRLKIVEGIAGTGKTTFLRQANRAWEEEGYTTFGVALQAVTAENIQKEAHIQKSSSLAKFFYDYEKETLNVDTKTVIVLDEAAMVGTQDLKKLTDICLATGAKTVWVGDRNQIQAIDPGGAFAGAADRFGKAELQEIWRQRGSHEWGRKAVYNAAKGAVTESLSELYEKGKVTFSDNNYEAKKALIQACAIGKDESLKETLILTSTNNQAESLNEMAQMVRIKEGKLSMNAPSFKVEGQSFFEGDRLLFKENNRSLNLKNGYRGTIEKVHKSGNVSVKLDSGEKRHFNPKEYTKVSLGYAHTTHLAQGQTKNKTFILADEGMIDKEMFYVQISRQRDDLKIFVNGQGESKADAYKTFLNRISKSNGEVLAHDLAKKLQAEELKESQKHSKEKERQEEKHRHGYGM
jgi:conjugative relaxase-like TrwC/TraI family protein